MDTRGVSAGLRGAATAAVAASADAVRSGDGAPILRLRNVSKVYPGAYALDRVDLELAVGTVHALVGENGAGKSTLLKIISGAETPSNGTVEIDGRPVAFHHPIAARRLGVVAVHQELAILPTLTAMANVFLGQERRRHRVVLDTRRMRQRFRALCDELAVSINPSQPAGTLSIADQQSLEIMRGLQADARILVLDEPTASLAVTEREALYANVKRLRAKGVAILLISHDLNEVLALSDVITVLRDGRKVATAPRAEWGKDSMVAAMLGEAAAGNVRARGLTGRRDTEEVLRVEDVRVPGSVRGVSFHARRGEVLGIAGLVGAGRTELLRAIAGLEPTSFGRMWVNGSQVAWPKGPRQARRLGIGLAPEDRKSQGLVLPLPAYANVTLPVTDQPAAGPVLLATRERSVAWRYASAMGVDRSRLDAVTSTLSGGNQQKLVLAKWIATGVPIFLVDEPTRGIDVGAKAEIFETLHGLADEGLTILLVSSELEEVVEHSDRVLVLAGGELVGELATDDADVGVILERIFDAEEASS